MKTEFSLILVFTFISLSFCDEEGCDLSNPSKKSDCTSRTLSTYEKDEGYDSCCYETYKYNGNDVSECTALPKKKVSDYIKAMKEVGYTDMSVDCNSKWLNFSMLLIGLVALLF